MSRVHRIAAGLAVAALTVAGLGVVTASASGLPENAAVGDQRHVPEQIRVPEGNRRIAVMPARGVQTYQCTAGAWTFLQPDAILEHRGEATVLHSRGPVWTSVRDGSSVTAAAVANAPVDNAIPQLLLRSTGNRGPGLLSGVTFIQRLDTRGGLAPAGACTDGATASIQYTAAYTFWIADNG
jgi:hypothetical protein